MIPREDSKNIARLFNLSTDKYMDFYGAASEARTLVYLHVRGVFVPVFARARKIFPTH